MRAKQKKDFRSHRLISGITIVLVGIITILYNITISIISGGKVNAADTTSTATIRVKSTCSMTATILPGEEHTASLINGVYSGDYTDTSNNTKPYENGIGKTTIQTFCNDPNGYAIYAIGYTGGDTGVANSTNTVLHSSILGSDYDIHTGTATSGDISNWAMKLTAKDDTGELYVPIIESDAEGSFSSYHTIPANYTKVAYYSSNTDAATIGSSLTTTYAAYISPTQPAGTYTGQVKYILVHPASGLDPDTRYMQDVEDWGYTLAVGEETTAYDNRDNKSYTVRRMCMDGTGDTWQEKEENCTDDMLWMTQNLDLCIGCTGTNTLTSENTNITEYQKDGVNFADYTIDGEGLVVWTPTASTMTGNPAYITTTDGTTVSGYSNDLNIPYMVEGGDRYSYQGIRYNSLADCKTAGHTAAECAHYHIGNYYNWSAAVAMSNTSTYTTNYTVMPNSICPKGWRLPNGITEDPTDNTVKIQSDFNKLLSTYNIANGTDLAGDTNVGWKTNGLVNIGLNPLYFARSGDARGSKLNDFNTAGNYWSSIPNNYYAYLLFYYSGELKPTGLLNRSYGRSVRCVSSDY